MRENASEMQQYTDPSMETTCASRSTSAMMGEASAQQVSKRENRIRKYPLDAGEPVRIESPTSACAAAPCIPCKKIRSGRWHQGAPGDRMSLAWEPKAGRGRRFR